MRIDIMTLFPDAVDAMMNASIIGRAQERGFVTIRTHQIREFTTNKQMQVDDYPYGGGRGAVMQADPLYRCWQHICDEAGGRVHTIYMSPCGRVLTQQVARELKAQHDHLILVCGHYEGVDQRFLDECVDEEISMGDFVLTGGEIPAMALADCLCRMVPGVLLAVALCVYVYFVAKKRNYPRTAPPKLRDYLLYLTKSIWAMLTPVILLVGIYTGIMTPTEAGAIAGLYALLVSFLIYRLMSWRTLKQVLVDTMKGTGSVSIMIGAASAISFIFAKEQIGTILGNWLLSVTANKYVFLFAVNIIILILGCLVDTSVIQLVMIPILWPVAEAMGINIIHFGLIICFNMMVGLSTPPFGMCLFITSGISGTPLKDIIREIWWPIIVMLIVLAVITYIPDVVLFLPKLTGMMA